MKLFSYCTILIIFYSIFAEAEGGRYWNKNIFISPFYGMGRITLHGQNDIPTYEGNIIGGDIEYKVGGDIALGVFANYYQGKFLNTNNSDEQRETIDLKAYNGGIKFYYYRAYLKGGGGKQSSSDKVRGSVSRDLDLSGTTIYAEAGVEYPIYGNTHIFAAVNAIRSKIEPKFGGLSERTQLVNYNAIVGLKFLIPSKPRLEAAESK